jgi:hypothetical protein
MSDVSYVERLELSFTPKPWAFARERRADIDAHFLAAQQENPALWNGRLLLMHEFGFDAGTFHGAYLETDFASFLAWRDWEYPDGAMRNCFAQAALRGSDGGYVLGVMAAHTANAGQIYFPSGTPDRGDIAGDKVDLEHSVRRELLEETGLTADALDVDPGWFVVPRGHSIALMKPMQAREPAEALRARILDWLSTQQQPELSDVVIARSQHDFSSRMKGYIAPFLSHVWRG